MTPNAVLQCLLYLVLLVVLGAPLGAYMAACTKDSRSWVIVCSGRWSVLFIVSPHSR
jgi:K+-transporting ATPase A subunit